MMMWCHTTFCMYVHYLRACIKCVHINLLVCTHTLCLHGLSIRMTVMYRWCVCVCVCLCGWVERRVDGRVWLAFSIDALLSMIFKESSDYLLLETTHATPVHYCEKTHFFFAKW